MRLFGFEIKRTDEDEHIESFVEPTFDDGAINVASNHTDAMGGAYALSLDFDGEIKSEADLIAKYRNISLQPEIQLAVDEITDAAIVIDNNDKIIDINLDEVKGYSSVVKKKIANEFADILNLLNFSENGHDLFRRWYIDGRLNMHIVIDENNPKDGIYEIRYIDPRKIKLIREIEEVKTSVQGATVKRIKNEYYVYSDFGLNDNSMTRSITSTVSGLRIAKDSIVRVTSGLMNENNTMVLSNLHVAIKPLNQLRMLEDAKLIYTLTRAPERKAFYVDVGNLPPAKAEQYLASMMAKHKNKVVYDTNTGEIKDDRRMMTMTQDWWFPRRGGNRSTEIDVLTGGSSIADNDDLNYYQKRLYKSLSVPHSRIEPEAMYAFGRPSEISREEIKFSRKVKRLRAKFASLFTQCLEKQLILKGIVTPEDWEEIKGNIRYDFIEDNFFDEMKNVEVLREKMQMLRDVDEQVGKYFTRDWVFKNVLYFNDQEKDEILKGIEQEKKDGIYDEDMGGVDIDGDGDDDIEVKVKPDYDNEIHDISNKKIINGD